MDGRKARTGAWRFCPGSSLWWDWSLCCSWALRTMPFHSFGLFLFRCHFKAQLWPTGPCPLSSCLLLLRRWRYRWAEGALRRRGQVSVQAGSQPVFILPNHQAEPAVLLLAWAQANSVYEVNTVARVLHPKVTLGTMEEPSSRPSVTWQPRLLAPIDASSTALG